MKFNKSLALRRCIALLATLLVVSMTITAAESPTNTVLKTEHFDRDPGWEGHNNRVVPKVGKMVKQDFGYSATHFAGKAKGEMGGIVQRTTTPASYATVLTLVRTLDHKLSALGSFSYATSQGGAGVFFGFFNSQQPGGSGRPIGSFGLKLRLTA